MTDDLYAGIDPFRVAAGLTAAERALLSRVRAFGEEEVAPIVADHWERAACPAHLRDRFAELGLADAPDEEPERAIFAGFRTFELARIDLSVSMLIGGQIGMFRTLVHEGGTARQVEAWDEEIRSFRRTGCFALTEPAHGSDIAGGIETTAERDGDTWVLNGRKRWIGNATISDHIGVVAREPATGRVLAFVVPRSAPGITLHVMERKIAVRMVHNADIDLASVRVPEELRLARIASFADINRAFRSLRADVVWTAAGMAAGAYEAARRHTLHRTQFGRPIASFQLIQEKLARMLGAVGATLAIAARLAESGEAIDDAAISLAKTLAARNLRECVALAREAMGGDGILLDHGAARFFADSEALYTFEGTHEINSLIVARSLTGISAFR